VTLGNVTGHHLLKLTVFLAMKNTYNWKMFKIPAFHVLGPVGELKECYGRNQLSGVQI